MKIIFSSINDHYPLCYDIAECKKTQFAKPETINLGADELLEMALKNQMTELQILALFTKNAFEGHLCHLNGIPIEKLVESGTMQIDYAGSNAFRDLTSEFFNNLNQYQKGLELSWEKMVNKMPAAGVIDMQSMLHFILANQLFRLPVSYLKGFDSYFFSGKSAQQKEQYRIQFRLHSNMLHHVSNRMFIEMVNEKYLEKFKDILLKLQSKENVLMQLTTRLDFANDPSIESEEQLNKKYFDFLVAMRTSETANKLQKLNPNLTEMREGKKIQPLLKPQIKKLYKIISKNCSEVHTHTEAQEQYQRLCQYFMDANSIYNNYAFDFSSLMLQYTKLVILLIAVINYRKLNNLPLDFADFTGISERPTVEIKEGDIMEYQDSLNTSAAVQKNFNFTDYKVKYVCDEEMEKIHRDYLMHQLEFLEQSILKVTEEIKLVMQNKKKVRSTI